jgi:hypothetical protein
MDARFISEPITPLELANTNMAAGEPALPQRFRWRDTEYEVARVIDKGKDYKPEGHKAGNEKYLRKHWFEIETTTGERMTIYCDRQARNRKKPQSRWWLYTLDDEGI